MRLKSKTSLILLIFVQVCGYSVSALASDCQQGIWDLTTTGKTVDGQQYAGAATSTRYCLFDGRVNLDEFRALSPEGNIVFMGASFDFPSNHGKRVQTLWVMGGDPGYTLIDGRMEGKKLVSTGKGSDAAGDFLERSVYVYSDNRDYTFDMDRSYDAGKTWIDSFSTIKATFRGSEVPPLPAEYHPMLKQARDALEKPAEGTIILSGLAEIEELDTSPDGETAPTIRFSSRYMNPDRWMSTFWTLGSDRVVHTQVEVGKLE